MTAPFRFDQTWVFGVSPADLFATVSRTECFTDWWSWLRRCDFDGVVDGIAAGADASCVIRAPLPYSLRFVVRIDRVEPDARIETSVRGDLSGPAVDSSGRPASGAHRPSGGGRSYKSHVPNNVNL